MKYKILLFFVFFISIVSYSQIDLSEKSLGFKPGEIQIIDSPDNDLFEPIIISTFREIHRIGVGIDYKIRTILPGESSEINKKRRWLSEYLMASQALYRDLIQINLFQKTIDFEKWKSEYNPNQSRSAYKNSSEYWIEFFRSITARTAKSELYSEYFCKDESNCKYADASLSSPFYYQRKTEPWGGILSNEFDKMNKVIKFTSNTAPTILKWAEKKELPKEAYFVGIVSIGEYDFNENGFPLYFRSEVNINYVSLIDREGIKEFLQPNYDNGKKGRVKQTGILLKMSSSKAENFLNKVGRQVYYVVKVNLEMVDETKNNQTSFFNIPEFRYRITSIGNKFEFFKNDYLTDKVYEFVR